MPSRFCNRTFIPGCFYHVYNRGAHQQLLFRNPKDYQVFTQILRYYLVNPLGLAPSSKSRLDKVKNKERFFVKSPPAHALLAYCLMPNHFHFMLKQISDEITISDLMRRVCTGYAMYFNDKYHHSGTIFQGKYKNILVENQYQWLYLSKYIHRNPLHLQRTVLCKNLMEYPYSSYRTYLGLDQNTWINTSPILSHTPSSKEIHSYQSFVEDGSDVGNIEPYTLDTDEEQFTKNGSL